MAMKLSTGKVAFPIEFDNGDKDCIYFNPNDPGLCSKLKNFGMAMTKKIQEIESLELDEKGDVKSAEETTIEAFETFQKAFFEELDYTFGGDVSSVVFKHCSPFAIVDGKYFVVQFIEAITPEIQKNIKKANADIEKKMSKHLNKYAK
jgi:hypothetical protein